MTSNQNAHNQELPKYAHKTTKNICHIKYLLQTIASIMISRNDKKKKKKSTEARNHHTRQTNEITRAVLSSRVDLKTIQHVKTTRSQKMHQDNRITTLIEIKQP